MAAASVAFLEEVQETVSGWLRRYNLDRSWLMETVIFLSRIGSAVRRKIFARDHDSRQYLVEEKQMSLEEINDPEVLAALNKEEKCTLQMKNS